VINSIITKETVLDYIPDGLNEKYHFMDKNRAVNLVHNPVNMVSVNEAIKKLKYEELFLFMLKMNYLKSNNSEDGLKREVSYDEIEKFVKGLPFNLTYDQEMSVKDIYRDLTLPKRMNRLLQGDVGSGKTIISFIALYINYLGGYQGALMAPTEILALQHYNNIQKILPNLKVVLLTGKMKAKEKKEILSDISNGQADIIIGTHALISDDVI